MATLKDISRKLSISVTTVSRALNGYSDVNEETRKRIHQAAVELNYRPNQFARKLVTGRSGLAAMVLPDDFGITTREIWFEILAGLSVEFAKHDIDFVLKVSPTDQIVNTYQRLIERNAMDGFVVIAALPKDERVSLLARNDVPLVLHGRSEQIVECPVFDINNYELMLQSMQHLLELGHRRIAFIGGPANHGFMIDRTRAYRAALASGGLPFNPDYIACGERMTEELGMVNSIRMCSSGGEEPTAFVCGNTMIAKGIYSAMQILGRNIPEDVSVVAHDDALPEYRAVDFRPALTVTRAPLRDSSRPLVDLLVRRIRGEPVESLTEIQEAEFLVRASTSSIESKA